MHVALIANTAWLDEDLAMFRYLVVGLLDEQVRVTQVVPVSVDADEVSGFCERVTWRDSSWSIVRRRRLGRLTDRLEELGVDLIHALDGRVWGGALKLAQQIELPLVLGASSSLDIQLVERLRRMKNLVNVAMVATTQPLAEAIQEKLEPEIDVSVVVPGVPAVEAASLQQREREKDDVLCAVVSGNGVYDSHYDALLFALKSVIDEYPDCQFFFDGQGSEQHQLWQAVQRYGLLANVSLAPRRLGHREMLLRADLLIHPQPLGRSRTLTLGAMAHGVPVMVLADPWLDYLIDQETAWVIHQPDATQWRDMIVEFVQDDSGGGELADRARRWVGQHHSPAVQVDQTLGVYRQVTGESIKFPQAQG